MRVAPFSAKSGFVPARLLEGDNLLCEPTFAPATHLEGVGVSATTLLRTPLRNAYNLDDEKSEVFFVCGLTFVLLALFTT